jgi:hypothetical protein
MTKPNISGNILRNNMQEGIFLLGKRIFFSQKFVFLRNLRYLCRHTDNNQ